GGRSTTTRIETSQLRAPKGWWLSGRGGRSTTTRIETQDYAPQRSRQKLAEEADPRQQGLKPAPARSDTEGSPGRGGTSTTTRIETHSAISCWMAAYSPRRQIHDNKD